MTPFSLLSSVIAPPTSVSMGFVVRVPTLSVTLYPDTVISARTGIDTDFKIVEIEYEPIYGNYIELLSTRG